MISANVIPLLALVVDFTLCLSMVQVTVDQGVLRGREFATHGNRTVYAFQGVPYAKPPLGDHRFKEPVMASSWIGVYDATAFSDVCMQYSHPHYKSAEPIEGSEDCLYLNVYTPEVPDVPGGRLSTIVMLHGGAFTFGSGNFVGAEFLLDHDVILVTVNYRLGPLGFLSTEDDVVPGNMGLKDQLLALKWVHRNIPSFGGDPTRITLAGMSAGAASVHYHLLSPKSRGYFHRAISMSGSALCPWAQTENAKEKTKRIAGNLGCPTTDSYTLIKCLRKRPAKKIVSQVKEFMPWLFYPFTPFGPTVEPQVPTAFIDEPPVDIILNRKANDVPWLISFDKDEGLYPGAGAGHGDDLGYTLKLYLIPGFMDAEHQHMIPFMTNIWASFADAKPTPWDWPDVKTSLPNLVVLNINGSLPEKNDLATFDDLGDELFWATLGMLENQVHRHTEL
ncbi:esterase FE4-like isoform X2 [Cimex lectularius]|uniref:Carboxylic ester hydrolase n=1 Tax=Cimex lectularius TaxID=79782 RepID=A0A8I6SGH8_CIMLE|nr:esterase FE4-like isoform X2 [Cimex lectularius]